MLTSWHGADPEYTVTPGADPEYTVTPLLLLLLRHVIDTNRQKETRVLHRTDAVHF